MTEVRITEAQARKLGLTPPKRERPARDLALPPLPEGSDLHGVCKQCGQEVRGGKDADRKHLEEFHYERGGCVIEYRCTTFE